MVEDCQQCYLHFFDYQHQIEQYLVVNLEEHLGYLMV